MGYRRKWWDGVAFVPAVSADNSLVTIAPNIAVTITTLAQPTTPVTYGADPALSATVTFQAGGGPVTTGTVEFEYQTGGSWTLISTAVAVNASGVATRTDTDPPVGTRIYRARYIATGSNAASTSATKSVVVNLIPTSTGISASSTDILAGQSVTIYCDVNPDTGGNATIYWSTDNASWSGIETKALAGNGTTNRVDTPGTVGGQYFQWRFAGTSTHAASNSSGIFVNRREKVSTSKTGPAQTSATWYGCNINQAEAVGSRFVVGQTNTIGIPQTDIYITSFTIEVAGANGEAGTARGAIWNETGGALLGYSSGYAHPAENTNPGAVSFTPTAEIHLTSGNYVIGFHREHTNCSYSTRYAYDSADTLGRLWHDNDMASLTTFTFDVIEPSGQQNLCWKINYYYWA